MRTAEFGSWPRGTFDTWDSGVEELERMAAEARRTLEYVERGLSLAKAYRRVGSMSVVLPDGQRLTDRPHVTGNPIQDCRNVFYKALDMSRRHGTPTTTLLPKGESR